MREGLGFIGSVKSKEMVIQCRSCSHLFDLNSVVIELVNGPAQLRQTMRAAIDGDPTAAPDLFVFMQKYHLPDIFSEFDGQCLDLLIDSIRKASEYDRERLLLPDGYAFNLLAVALVNLLMTRAGGQEGFIRICGSRLNEFDDEILRLLETKIAPAARLIGHGEWEEERIKTCLVPLIRRLRSTFR